MTILTADWVVPISSEPIENGWIRIENGIITGIGQGDVGATHSASAAASAKEAASPSEDLGNAAIFPGLINCHAHLEFARGDHPQNSFAEWAESVQESQQNSNDTEVIWQQNMQRLLETGTTTVVNHGNWAFKGCHSERSEESPESQQILRRTAPQNDKHISAHIIQICEFVGASAENGARSYRNACEQRTNLLQGGLIDDAHVSPHSLYAVSPVAWDHFIEQRTGTLLSVHVKESAEEDQLFTKGKGPLAHLVKERGGLLWQHDPIGWLKEKQLLQAGTLLIHGNYLNDSDLAHLQGSGASVIHCPGSHAYFGHRRFPLEALQKHNICVALGTDSLASNEDLSMLREMQLFGTNDAIQMATLNGAMALGIDSTRGSIETDKWADLIAVPMGSADDPHEALFNADQVSMTMVRGRIVHRHGI